MAPSKSQDGNNDKKQSHIRPPLSNLPAPPTIQPFLSSQAPLAALEAPPADAPVPTWAVYQISSAQGQEHWPKCINRAEIGGHTRPPVTKLLKEGEGIKRILVAEDNVVNQEIIAQKLESSGFVVDVVADGIEAEEALGSFF